MWAYEKFNSILNFRTSHSSITIDITANRMELNKWIVMKVAHSSNSENSEIAIKIILTGYVHVCTFYSKSVTFEVEYTVCSIKQYFCSLFMQAFFFILATNRNWSSSSVRQMCWVRVFYSNNWRYFPFFFSGFLEFQTVTCVDIGIHYITYKTNQPTIKNV